jgi:glycosyltransferase involved in cell wall biosynthesis
MSNAKFSEPAYILCVGNGWLLSKPGGLERYVYELAHHLAAEQDRIELLGVGLPASDPNPLIKLTNLAESDSPMWRRLWATRTQWTQRQAPQPDAINLHFAPYSFPLLPSLPSGVPITYTFHGPWGLESQGEGSSQLNVLVKRWIEQLVYRRCNRFIVLSKAFGAILHQQYGIPWEKIHIIPGGVDTTYFRPNLSRQEARAQLDWPLDRRILFTPRRLVHRMGLDKLLTALIQVKAQVPDVWLAIAGKGPLRNDLERQVQQLGLESHVRFLGFLPDEQLPIAYQAADLTVVPSQSLEGFGLILLESLACGTPALCTPVGGMPEVLDPFCPDLVTQTPEEASIGERLIELLSGRIALPSRTACYEYASTHFDWKIIAQKVRQVLMLKIE